MSTAADDVTLQLNPPGVSRRMLATLYWEAFGEPLTNLLMGSPPRALALVEAAADPGRALCALRGDTVLGLAALRYGGRCFLSPRPRACLAAAGPLRGVPAYAGLSLVGHGAGPDEMYVESLAVRADCRGQGIGRALLQHAFVLARDEGLAAVSLDVVDTNTGACRLYERAGFRAVAVSRYPFTGRLLGFSSIIRMVQPLNSPAIAP